MPSWLLTLLYEKYKDERREGKRGIGGNGKSDGNGMGCKRRGKGIGNNGKGIEGEVKAKGEGRGNAK